MPHPPATSAPARPLGRLAIPIAAAGIAVACLAVLLEGGHTPPVTESQVHREIRQIALKRADGGYPEDGGSVGPWWISAREVDPLTGIFHDFKLTSGDVHLAATTAVLRIDPDTDMLSFHLEDVVLTRVLDADENEPDRRLHRLDEFDLGPVHWKDDIARDGADGVVAPAAAP